MASRPTYPAGLKPARSRSFTVLQPGNDSINVPFFAGHGTSSVNSTQVRQQALLDATSSAGSFLLSTCHTCFIQELSSLPLSEKTIIGIDLADFKTKEALLHPHTRAYTRNPVISGSALFLMQILRYLAMVEWWNTSTASNHITPFSEILKENAEHGVGILGFSSGVLPACVAGSSFTTSDYVNNAVEFYRLALWIGIRLQFYKSETQFAKSTLSWSCVFLGLPRQTAEARISRFHDDLKDKSSLLGITAIMPDGVTISGRPDILAKFCFEYCGDLRHHDTQVDTLYHSPALDDAKALIHQDVVRRKIRLPDLSDFSTPIRSTVDGKMLVPTELPNSLLTLLLDMVLTETVHWDVTLGEVAALVSVLPPALQFTLYNIGPGSGLLRPVERVFPFDRLLTRDWAISSDIPLDAYTSPAVSQEPIAIVGMSIRLPGASTLGEFWQLLQQGLNTITEIPEHRFDVSAYNPLNPRNHLRILNAQLGNFIDGVDEFDPRFFKLSRRDAKQMDPQQRLLLLAAYHALEHAGFVPDATPTSRPSRVGCYVGVATHDYVHNLRNDIDAHYATGTLGAFLSGRISHCLGLSGPSLVVDTACSSSLVAIYQGCRALANRDCDAALVGGANTITSPDMQMGLDRGHFLSPDTQCLPFDSSANGYARGEGCGVFVLKRLTDAKAENDRILAVIRGVEVNQSGCASSITHPHPATQVALFEQLLEKSGVSPHRVNVVEAHGTGTQAGDPAEMASIRQVFARDRPGENPLHITAVKANIGHSEAASGAASLAKLVLMMHRGLIPPTISLKTLNPEIAPLEEDSIRIGTELVSWHPSHPGHNRMAVLNNFGAAGSNAALILEEYPPEGSPLSALPAAPFVFGLSAKTEKAIKDLRSHFTSWLQNEEFQEELANVAYTTTARRQIYTWRLCVQAATRQELIQKLESVSPRRIQEGDGPSRVVFVFSGQGGQHIGMGRGLFECSAFFRDQVYECDSILISLGFPSILPMIAPSSYDSFSEARRCECFQVAVFVLEYALAKLWVSWNVKPDAVIGHSLGEYAALVFANVLSLRDALYLVGKRAQLMVQQCPLEQTGMLAVKLPPEEIQAILASSVTFPDVDISCFNGPSDCVLSGPLDQIHALKRHLDSHRPTKLVLLDVPFGYHSSAMSPILEELDDIARDVTCRPPQLPVVSTMTGEVAKPGQPSPFTPRYFSRHCSQPVLFEQGVNALTNDSAIGSMAAWIEIGPHPSCLPMLKSQEAVVSANSLFLPSLKRHQDPNLVLGSSLSQLYYSHLPINWRAVFSSLQPTCVDLPSYPFDLDKFWVPYQESSISHTQDVAIRQDSLGLPSNISEFPLLSRWITYPSLHNGFTAIFETPIAVLEHFMESHIVAGYPLCPASVYLELVLAGIVLLRRRSGTASDDLQPVLRGVEYPKPLVYQPEVSRIILITISMIDGAGEFSITSSLDSLKTEESKHAFGTYRLQPISQISAKLGRTLPAILRQMDGVKESKKRVEPDVFSAHTIYEKIFPRVVKYSKEFQVIQSLTVAVGGMEGLAEVRFLLDPEASRYSIHPAFLDALLHVSGLVANHHGDSVHAYILHQMGSFKLFVPQIDLQKSYTIYCCNSWVANERVMYSDAYCFQLQDPSRVVAHIKRMAFRRLKLDGLSAILESAGDPFLRRPISNYPLSPISPRKHRKSGHHDVPRFRIGSSPSTTDTYDKVLKIVRRACDNANEAIDGSTVLEELGVDSLTAMEIHGLLREAFPSLVIESQIVLNSTTFHDLVSEVDRCVSESCLSTPMSLLTDEEAYSDSPFSPGVPLTPLTPHTPRRFPYSEGVRTRGNPMKLTFGGPLEELPSNAKNSRQSLPYFSEPSQEMVRPDHNLYLLRRALGHNNTPICFIHDGSGLTSYYERIDQLHRDVWCLPDPLFASETCWSSINEMAQHYCEVLIGCLHRVPILLGGWSFGAIVAYEMALILVDKGYTVKGLVLLDPPSPVDHVPLSAALVESVLRNDMKHTQSDLRRLVKNHFKESSRLLGDHSISSASSCPPIAILRSSQGFQPVGMENVPQWLSDRSDSKAIVNEWQHVSSATIRSFAIPGHHFNPFDSHNLHEVSKRIAEACEILERS